MSSFATFGTASWRPRLCLASFDTEQVGKLSVDFLALRYQVLDLRNPFVEHSNLLWLVNSKIRMPCPLPWDSQDVRRWRRGLLQRRKRWHRFEQKMCAAFPLGDLADELHDVSHMLLVGCHI
jgi:hypothetical protein